MCGNLKAIIPLVREKFFLEQEEVAKDQFRDRYKKISCEAIYEKRIFGILTCYQPGFIPNL